MAMRSAVALSVLVLAAPAAAETFGGFSGIDRAYLVNRDKVCAPLAVQDAGASGSPQCETTTADVVAKLSIKDPISQKGVNGTFTATATGRTLVVAKKTGEAVVTWQAPDAIGRIVDVYASQYEDRVAVAYTMRRLGKEITDIVAFELVKTTGRTTTTPAKPGDTTQPARPTQPGAAPTTTAPADPALTKAVAAARKAPRAKALAAWRAVLALDAEHSEAQFRIAVAHAAAKQRAEAIAALEKLAASSRPDAVEWLVEARFDKAFASVRSDATYRAAVGLDRPAKSAYERLMGLGGQWEQTETHCDKPQVLMTMNRDRTFKLRVKSNCRGSSYNIPFKGTWQITGDGVTLTLPTKGKQVTEKDEAPCELDRQGDEDALHCVLDRDLDFTVLPTRR